MRYNLNMNLTRIRGGIEFWDHFASWYEKWLTRGTYHHGITREVSQMIEPGWRVLDIGAGTGVLSIPMDSLGCAVTALEPSLGMRDLFTSKLANHGIRNVQIIDQRWEDFSVPCEYDLIIACNSLQLTAGGIASGMQKVFSAGGRYVCLITEINQDIFVDFKDISDAQDGYDFLSVREFRVDSSFHFESLDEAKTLGSFLQRIIPVEMLEGGLAQRDCTDIAILWWEHKAA